MPHHVRALSLALPRPRHHACHSRARAFSCVAQCSACLSITTASPIRPDAPFTENRGKNGNWRGSPRCELRQKRQPAAIRRPRIAAKTAAFCVSHRQGIHAHRPVPRPVTTRTLACAAKTATAPADKKSCPGLAQACMPRCLPIALRAPRATRPPLSSAEGRGWEKGRPDRERGHPWARSLPSWRRVSLCYATMQ